MQGKKFFLLLFFISFIATMSVLSPGFHKVNASFHTPEELDAYRHGLRAPIKEGEYFLPSFRCAGCHGYDSMQLANINEEGFDVNLVDRWQSSMMALSAIDPFWRAKVSHEIAVNPAHASALQDKCTSCHAPMGRYTKFYHNEGAYTLAEIDSDSLGRDGVSCSGCHSISTSVGLTFSGEIPFDTFPHVAYGPFPGPYQGPMQLYEGFTPLYSPHMDESRVCSSCHTLITQTADLSGNLTGDEFVEQATYHEYLNSAYPSLEKTCQSCHMPKIEDPIIIANGFSDLDGRSPFNQHTFAGANFFMLQLMKQNRSALGISVEEAKFDSSIFATKEMLLEKSVAIDLTQDSITADTAYFTVNIENKAGHKFPSGYPARRAVVQFVVFDSNNDTIFKSGLFDSQFRIVNENPAYEPHYNIIKQNHVSQIYEMAMGDVNSNFTSVLERAAVVLKDNRIPPLGFTTQHAAYDTAVISADALADPDFNKVNNIEGSGKDAVHFHVPVAGIYGTIKVKTVIFYQPIPPKWLDELFTFNTNEIDAFRAMYEQADKTPLAIAADSLENIPLVTGIVLREKQEPNVYPTATNDGKVFITLNEGNIMRIRVFSSEGKLTGEFLPQGKNTQVFIRLPQQAGVYYLSIETSKKTFHRKVMRL